MKNVDICNRLLSLINQTTYKGQSQVNLTYFLQQQTPKKNFFFSLRYWWYKVITQGQSARDSRDIKRTIVRQRIVLAIGVCFIYFIYLFIYLFFLSSYISHFHLPRPTKKRVARSLRLSSVYTHTNYSIHARMHTRESAPGGGKRKRTAPKVTINTALLVDSTCGPLDREPNK